MSDGSEARQGEDSLGMEIPEPLDMRSCPGYTNQELSSLPSHILLPKDAAGRQLVPRGGAWPRRMAQISAQLLTQSLSPNTLPFPQMKTPDGPGDQNMHLAPPPSAHDSVHCCFAMRLPGGQVTTLNDQ